MEDEQTAETHGARLRRDRLRVFDLRTIISALWWVPESGERGRAEMTLVKTRGLRVLMEVLEEGERLVEHQVFGSITLHVLEGEVRIASGDEVVYVRKGELLALPSVRPYSVEAVRDSSLLLTIAPERHEEETSS